MEYSGQVFNVDGLIELLINQDLIIEDKDYAKKAINNVGYVSLKRYFDHCCTVRSPNRKFREGTYFEDVFELYRIDSTLRVFVLEGLFKIELAVKSVLNDILTSSYGSHWYNNESLFDSRFTSSPSSSEPSKYGALIDKIRKDCKETDDPYVKGYCYNYKNPELPPSWMVLDLLPFGKISIIFENLVTNSEKTLVASKFELTRNILNSWLRTFAYVRNLCAHHQKLIYRPIKFKPLFPSRTKHKFLNESDDIQQDKLYAVLCCMQFILKQIDGENLFGEYLVDWVQHYSHLKLDALGFTLNWEDEDIWKIEPSS